MSSEPTWRELLAAIRAEVPASARPACTEVELDALARRVVETFGCDLPDAYREFLRETDGLAWNELTLYAARPTAGAGGEDRGPPGLLEANERWRVEEGLEDHLVLGDDGAVLYSFHIPSESYQVLLVVGHAMLEAYGDCETLLVDALGTHE